MIRNYLVPQGCKYEEQDESTSGFDAQAGATWIYPTNYPPRDYQFNIIQEALLRNVLVSLPTGLGKTFIAAVVMYNFYRWYPSGKVIFLAPTRPLVKQQVDACYNIMAIPKDVTAELTGSKIQTSRNEIWAGKRVIFATPQVLQNDLDTIPELAGLIRCVVFDEAHRAKGNHAYCEVIRKIYPKNAFFRVLALSATPGSSLNDVTDVIRNLLISHVEFRTDESSDVTPYVQHRTLETVVVPLDTKLQQVRDDYIQVLEVYTRVLMTHKVIAGNCSLLTKGKIFMTMKDFQEKGRSNRHYSEIMKNLNICITLYHAYELLIRHGLRGFLTFCEEHANKPLLRGNAKLHHIMDDVKQFLGPAPNLDPLPDGSLPDIPPTTKFGHPKYYKLQEVLLEHFGKPEQASSRVIVFFEYRDSVTEAYALLLQNKPIVEARLFLGQAAMTQRQQISIMNAFRSGQCNTLLSTCIGEEGLDVGEVNLIICFDISSKSPIRMVQRMGRTGRKTQGRVVMLVTEGREQQTLNDCIQQKKHFSKNILASIDFNQHIFVPSPRMVPKDITPSCIKMFITVKSEPTKTSKAKPKTKTLKQMFEKISSDNFFQESGSVSSENFIDRIPKQLNYWNRIELTDLCGEEPSNSCGKTIFNKHLEKSRSLQNSSMIGHSLQSEMLVSLLQFSDSKRYNIPMTQTQYKLNQTGSKNPKTTVGGNFKQSDIRMMFGKTKSTEDFDRNIPETQLPSPMKLDIEWDKQIFRELTSEVETYLTIKCAEHFYCKICENLFPCYDLKCFQTDKQASGEWPQIEANSYENVSEIDLDNFLESVEADIKIRKIPHGKSAPKTLGFAGETGEDHKAVLDFFKLGSLEDLFEARNSNTFSAVKDLSTVEKVVSNSNDSISYSPNIFDSPMSNNKSPSLLGSCQKSFLRSCEKWSDKSLELKSPELKSPGLKSNEFKSPESKSNESKSTESKSRNSSDNSPVLCTFSRVTEYKRRAKKRLFNNSFKKTVDCDDNSKEITTKNEFTLENKADITTPEGVLKTNVLMKKTNEFTWKTSEGVIKPNDIPKTNKTVLPNELLEKTNEAALKTNEGILKTNEGVLKTNEVVKKTNEAAVTTKSSELSFLFDDFDISALSQQIRDVCDLSMFNFDSPAKHSSPNNKNTISDVPKGTNLNNNSTKNNNPTKSNNSTITKSCQVLPKQSLVIQKNSQVILKNSQVLAKNSQEIIPKPSSQISLEIEDICDLSSLGFETFGNVSPIVGNNRRSKFNRITPNKTQKLSFQNKPPSSQKNQNEVTVTQALNIIELENHSYKSGNNNTDKLCNNSKTKLENNRDKLSMIRRDKLGNTKDKLDIISNRNKPSTSGNNKDRGWLNTKHDFKLPAKPVIRNTTKSASNFIPSDDDDFETSVSCHKKSGNREKDVSFAAKSKESTKTRSYKPQKRKRSKASEFLDLEAELSGDECVSEDELDSNEDLYEASFVDDGTQNVCDTTNIHARYLQSVRSPRVGRGRFKIPERPLREVTDVYSQQVCHEDNSYVNDSFCVNTEAIDLTQEDLSELEIAEMMLKERRRNKRKEREKDKRAPAKRRRVICISSDESE